MKTLADIYQKHRDELVNLATLKVGSRHAAEDIVQETFVKILNKGGLRLDSDSYVRNYMAKAVQMKCYDYNRDKSKYDAKINKMTTECHCYTDDADKVFGDRKGDGDEWVARAFGDQCKWDCDDFEDDWDNEYVDLGENY